MFWLVMACAGAPEPAQQPDILFVVLDTVRADRLGMYGGPQDNSRQLAAAAAAGIRFDDAHVSSNWSWPSHATMFTGLPPWEHGGHRHPDGTRKSTLKMDAMRTDVPTIAEQLDQAGYRTHAIAVNPWLEPELGLLRGFETVAIPPDDADALTLAGELLAEDHDEPLFLFVNLMAAHAPYTTAEVPWVPPAPEWAAPFLNVKGFSPYEEVETKNGTIPAVLAAVAGLEPVPPHGHDYLKARYDAGLAQADAMLNVLLTHWNQHRADGVVLVTSDHGEFLGERGGLLDHGWTVYPEVTWVPLVLVAPGRIEPGQVRTDPVTLERIAPTFRQLAGLEAGAPTLLDEGTSRRAKSWSDGHLDGIALPEFDQVAHLVVEGDVGLVIGDKTGELVLAAPQLLEPTTGDLERLRAMSEHVDAPGGGDLEMGAEQEAALRALGYLD